MFDTFEHIAIGFSAAVTVNNILYCFVGVTLGTLVGVIPGIGALAAISVLFPITFHLDPLAALVMLGGIFYGTTYGGSTASILLNLPGTPANAVACIDGYPMAKQGRAGVALFITTIASFVGASFGILVMMAFSPYLVEFALNFGPADNFSMVLMGIVATSVISTGSPLKGFAMVILGVLIGMVGTDLYTGAARLTFGFNELRDGIGVAVLAMGIFGVAEIIFSIRAARTGQELKGISIKSMMPTRDDMKRSWFPMLRGSVIGSFFGPLPGTGGTVASFMSYIAEKRISKEPKRFGNGAIEGLAGPEAANNSAEQTAFIPTLTLGIPGTPTMALMLGVLMIHGITPGPSTMANHPEIFWGVIVSFWIGNIILVILNLPLIGIWVRVLMVPYYILYPVVLMLMAIGVYSINNSPFDVLLLMIFGALGYWMRLLDFPTPPLLVGFVLGPMLEEHFRRAMILSRGSLDIFIEKPMSSTFLIATLVFILLAAWSSHRSKKK